MIVRMLPEAPYPRHLVKGLALLTIMLFGIFLSKRLRGSEPWKTGKWLLLVVMIVVIAVFIFLAASSP